MSFHLYSLLAELEAPVNLPPTLISGFGFNQLTLLRTIDGKVHTQEVSIDRLELGIRKLALYPFDSKFPAVVLKLAGKTELLAELTPARVITLIEANIEFSAQAYVRAKVPRQVIRTMFKFPGYFTVKKTDNKLSSNKPKLTITSLVDSKLRRRRKPFYEVSPEPRALTEAVWQALQASFYKLQMSFESISLNMIYDSRAEWFFISLHSYSVREKTSHKKSRSDLKSTRSSSKLSQTKVKQFGFPSHIQSSRLARSASSRSRQVAQLNKMMYCDGVLSKSRIKQLDSIISDVKARYDREMLDLRIFIETSRPKPVKKSVGISSSK